MITFSRIADTFSRGLDAAAECFFALREQLSPPRVVKFVENEGGELVPQTDEGIHDFDSKNPSAKLSTSRVELVLRPERFLFRPLELPAQAADFLDGIVRTQLDRLTPWNAADAAFGWTKLAAAEPGRILVSVAAIKRDLIMPIVQPVISLGAASVSVFTQAPELESHLASIKVLDLSAPHLPGLAGIRRVLLRILAASGAAAAVVVSASILMSVSLQARQNAVAERLAQVREAVSASRQSQLQSVAGREQVILARKYSEPAAVVVLEDLSRVLPDHTFVTELRIEGDRLQIAGVTRDAPGLIGLLERSSRFARATFFAPTTRSPGDAGDRFHIEAHIQPLGRP